jgi:hypothetical protein
MPGRGGVALGSLSSGLGCAARLFQLGDLLGAPSSSVAEVARELLRVVEELEEGAAAKQRSGRPQKPRACLSQAPTKRGVCASLRAPLTLAL